MRRTFRTLPALYWQFATKSVVFTLVSVMGIIVAVPTASAQGGDASEPQVQPPTEARQADDMDAFVADLIGRMTLEEKIGQLTLFTSDWDTTGPTLRADYEENIAAGRVGSIFNAYTADYTRRLQRLAVEETRLGIPLLFGYDVIHGHRTIFPISLGEAATWDMDAIELSARIAATEAAAEGIHWTFAPMVDVTRDPRWGRVSEGAGEDVYLGSLIARARVRGFQGDDLAATDTILATAKHFAAYGAAAAGRDYNTVDMSDRRLRETYLPPFKAAIDAGAATLMTAFNELNGIPATGDSYLLRDILRDEWGFDGLVVTDYTSINEMVLHGFARDDRHAGEIAINAGVDVDMQGSVYLDHLQSLVEAGSVDTARIDGAVRYVLEAKWKLGLFDDPYRYSDAERQRQTVYRPDFLDAARDVARKSMVLLRNENEALPLTEETTSIALIGPLADSKIDMIGSWSAAGDRQERPVTVREGLAARLGEAVTINYAPGSGYGFGSASDHSGFADAVAAAEASDVIVAVVGEPYEMSGEAASRTSLELPGAQPALLRALKETGKPLIVVLMNGRPLAINWTARNADAILEAWYPGTMAGHAVADVLYGDHNPSGKLPITFPRTVGQVPIHYDQKPTGRPYVADGEEQKYLSRYLDTPNTPLYPFGFGLSYTSFEYSPIELSAETIAPGQTLTASVRVRNAGDRAGEETVQLYLRDVTASVTRPVKELKGFEKIELRPGEERTVDFEIGEDQLAFYRSDMSFGTEPGTFEVFIGTSSADTVGATFELTE